MSPLGRVPALLHDGGCVCESTVINEYLEEALPSCEYPLLPRDPLSRAAQRALVARADARVLPAGFRYLCYGGDEQKAEWLAELRFLSGALGDHPFLGGERMGLADVALAPFFELLDAALAAHRGGGVLDACARDGLASLVAWYERVRRTPAYARTSPGNPEAIAQVYHPEAVRGMSYLRQ